MTINTINHCQDIWSALLQQEEYLIIKTSTVQVEVNHTSGSVWLLKTTLFNPNIAALLQTAVYLGLGLPFETTVSQTFTSVAIQLPPITHTPKPPWLVKWVWCGAAVWTGILWEFLEEHSSKSFWSSSARWNLPEPQHHSYSGEHPFMPRKTTVGFINESLHGELVKIWRTVTDTEVQFN